MKGEAIFKPIMRSAVVAGHGVKNTSVGLTTIVCPSNLKRMSFAKRVLFAVLTLALSGYALDCDALATPQQAMQCCGSMHCSSHGHHGQDCCKTMPSLRAAVGQPSSGQSAAFSLVVVGAAPVSHGFFAINVETCIVAEHSHAPPLSSSPPNLPLRI